MSKTETGNANAEHERIKNRKTRLEQKRDQRRDENPAAFAWEQTDEHEYECIECGKTYRKLPGCLRHINNVHDTERDDGQSGLGEWV